MSKANNRLPRLYRRLRVVLDDHESGGYVPAVRDVYLESTLCPIGKDDDGNLIDGDWTIELCNVSIDCSRVADMIRWANQIGLPVEEEPRGNMSKWTRGKRRKDEAYLFDPS